MKISPTTGVVLNGTYTIVALFEFDSVSNFRRIVDFKNGTSDNGLYVQNGNLRFFPSASGTGAPIAANTYVQVALTRDSSGTVVGYVDGVQQFSFSDPSNDAVIDSNNALRFFRDNESGGTTGEHSAGSVARIRLYDTALTAVEIGEQDRTEPTVFTVNSTADDTDNLLQDGKCSTGVPQQCTLRAAVQQSNHTLGNDTINFAPGLSGTINLTQGHLSINNESDSLTINGPKPRPVARILTVSVSATNPSRAFFIADDATAVINRLKITNGNTAFNGGGISNGGDSLTLTNSTVSGNNAFIDGGGIFNDGGTATLLNTIVAGNFADSSLDASGSFSGQDNNLIGDTSGAFGFGGSDVLDKDPLLGPLQDNGGSTDTHALLSRSPAIDKGTNAGCPRTDQRGKARPMDGDGKGKALCDIGSFEKKKVRRR